MKDDAHADQKIVLRVGGGVGELRAEPANLYGAYGEMKGKAYVHSSARLRCRH